MRKLLTLVLLLAASGAWAQESMTMTPSATPATPQTTQTSSTPAGTPSAAASASATPTGTPAAMPAPPALSVASTPVQSNPIGEHFVFQLDGGIAPAVSSASATVFNSGFGIDGRISYAFDNVFSMGLETGFYDLGVNPKSTSLPSGATSDMTHIPVLFVMQIYFGDADGPIQPYLVLAGGMSFDAVNLQGAAYKAGVNYGWANFELDPAVGVAYVLDTNMNLFVQAKWVMDFTDNASNDVNAESQDSPIMLLPLQAGLNFNL
jgi:hypothetical protein